MESLVLKPIGVVHREASNDEVRHEPHGLDSEIEVYPQYRAAQLDVSLPWPRTFEIESTIRLTKAGIADAGKL